MDELEQDDIQFRAEEFNVLPPKDYARHADIASPQLVYYYIRNGLPHKACECGRTVVLVKEADEWLQQRRRAKAQVDLSSDESD